MKVSHYLNSAIAVFVSLALFGVCYGQFSVFGIAELSTALSPWQPWWLYCGAIALLLLVFRAAFAQSDDSVSVHYTVPAATLLLFLCSEIADRRFSFFTGGDAIYFVLLLGLPIVGLQVLRWKYEHVDDGARRFFSLPLLLFFQVLVAVLFLHLADGRVIFSDDHPSFWYRFYLLNEQFPAIPFYSPAWNAGYSAREFFASGILNVYFLSYPLWLLGFDLSQLQDATLYNYLIVYIFLFVLPWSVWCAARLLGFSKSVATIAGVLALGPSVGQFEWLLKYGTLGFCCSIGFAPLAIAFVYRLAFRSEAPHKFDVFGLLLSSSLVVVWSLSVFIFIPAVLLGLVYWRTTFAPTKRGLVALFAIFFLCVHLPWVKIFIEESKVLSFVSKTELPGAAKGSESASRVLAKKAERNEVSHRGTAERPQKHVEANARSFASEMQNLLRDARQLIAKVNPVLVFLLLPGILLFRCSRLRWLYGTTIVFLLLLAFFGELLKPQLELRRMILPAAYLACIPVALFIEQLFSQIESVVGSARRKASMLAQSIALGSLLLISGVLLYSPVTVAAVFQNQSDERYVFAPESLGDLSESIRAHAGSGRVFFLGFVLHELGATNYRSQDGGHVAILAALSGVPMYSHFYYHSHWHTVDPIPSSYRDRGQEGVEEFLDLVNATAVVTPKREWVAYCQRTPGYREVAQFDRFYVFERVGPANGFVLEGRAEVREGIDFLSVTPISEHLILKYRFLPKLRVSHPELAELSAVPAFIEETGEQSSEQVDYIQMTVRPEGLGVPIRLSY